MSTVSNGLDVVGRLSLALGDSTDVSVDFQGDTIVVAWPDVRSALSLIRHVPSRRRREWLGGVNEGLLRAGLTMLVEIRGVLVGRLGVGSRSGLASSVLGVGPMEVKLSALLRLLSGRNVAGGAIETGNSPGVDGPQ